MAAGTDCLGETLEEGVGDVEASVVCNVTQISEVSSACPQLYTQTQRVVPSLTSVHELSKKENKNQNGR